MSGPGGQTPNGATAGVLIFPPLLFTGTLAVGLLAHWLDPRPLLPSWPARIAGLLLLVGSAGLVLAAERAFKRAGTNVRPDQPSLALVSDGPFRFTRNPMYVATTGLYLAVALLLNALWPVVLAIPMLMVLHWGVVRREERYLESKFGDPYRRYRERVRRWI
jgi:protein-S-isoprenylcysteine O-methyltransferase Ste14